MWVSLLCIGWFAAEVAEGAGFTQSEFDWDHELNRLEESPRSYRDQLPPKYDAFGRVVQSSVLGPSVRDFIKVKDQVRRQIVGKSVKIERRTLSRATEYEPVEWLLDNRQVVRRIADMDREQLTEGHLTQKPWSDDYWPINHGILGKRYADPNFPFKEDWSVNFKYVLQFGALPIFGSADPQKIDELSPSEKYDLLLANDQLELTRMMWAEGQEYFDRDGKVETWMGICHGWAVASYSLPRPRNKITVMAADGQTSITFYPSDIKALASLLWANGDAAFRYVGGRCDVKNPERDDNGRIIDQRCFDTNPATWHLAVVNQIGIAKRAFVMDANYDYQVWNQPIVGYDYIYFNPQTNKRTTELETALIPLSEFNKDKYKTYRSEDAKSVVGIGMEVQYMFENQPAQRDADGEAFDVTHKVHYLYDLELDAEGVIIGGEWYSNFHPDFLWTAAQGSRAISVGDYDLGGESLWDGTSVLKKKWRESAALSASQSTPLARIVESLITLSNQRPH